MTSVNAAGAPAISGVYAPPAPTVSTSHGRQALRIEHQTIQGIDFVQIEFEHTHVSFELHRSPVLFSIYWPSETKASDFIRACTQLLGPYIQRVLTGSNCKGEQELLSYTFAEIESAVANATSDFDSSYTFLRAEGEVYSLVWQLLPQARLESTQLVRSAGMLSPHFDLKMVEIFIHETAAGSAEIADNIDVIDFLASRSYRELEEL